MVLTTRRYDRQVQLEHREQGTMVEKTSSANRERDIEELIEFQSYSKLFQELPGLLGPNRMLLQLLKKQKKNKKKNKQTKTIILM